MSRAPRIQATDVIYHVGSRGVEKRSIFGVIPSDRTRWLSFFDATIRRFGWRCHAYCLMGNHFHLVVDTPGANISAGMQFLKGEYARWFNTYHADREGALFERRFWSRIATSEVGVAAFARYVALNPVRAGFVDAPEDWPWSSYAATVGLAPAPRYLHLDTLLGLFGGGRGARVRYAQFVGEGIADPGRAALAIEDMSVGLTPK